MVGSGAGRQTRARQILGRHLRPGVDQSLFGKDGLVLRMHTQSSAIAVRNVAPAGSRPSKSMRSLPLSHGAVSPSEIWTRRSTRLVDVTTTGALSFARSPLEAVTIAAAERTAAAPGAMRGMRCVRDVEAVGTTRT